MLDREFMYIGSAGPGRAEGWAGGINLMGRFEAQVPMCIVKIKNEINKLAKPYVLFDFSI